MNLPAKLLLCVCMLANLLFAGGVPLSGCGGCGGRVVAEAPACCPCCQNASHGHAKQMSPGRCDCCLKSPVAPKPAPGQDEKPGQDAGVRRVYVAAAYCVPQVMPAAATIASEPAEWWGAGPPRSVCAARAVRRLI